MTHAPFDTCLPHFADAIEDWTITGLVGDLIAREAGIDVLGWRPCYVRYKPGTNATVQYDVALRLANGRAIRTTAQIKLYADDRGLKRATNRRMRELHDRGRQIDPDLAAIQVMHLPDLRGLLQLYPIDYDLPALVGLLSDRTVDQILAARLPDEVDRWQTAAPELIRYKPGRKALLRFPSKDHATSLYVKLVEDMRGDVLEPVTAELREAGIATPPLAFTWPDLRLLAYRAVDGTSLDVLRTTAAHAIWMDEVASGLASFQAVPVDTPVMRRLPTHSLHDEARTVQRTAALLSVVHPDLEPRLRAVADGIADALSEASPIARLAHGDFYDDQVIVSPAGVTIIDLDELQVAHPLQDIGNMAAHLASGDLRADRTARSRERFLSAALAGTAWTDRDLAPFEAASLFKLAPGPFRRLEEHWPVEIERILALAENRLADATRSAPVAMPGSPPPADDALPHLETVLDVQRMSAHLAPVIGDATLSHIELLRHKPGRRAILRYTLDGKHGVRELYGKTFASKRGPKVYRIAEQITAAHAFGDDVATPAPVAWIPELKLILQEGCAGDPVGPALLAGDTTLAERIARALAAFHASGLDLGRSHDLAKELRPLPGRVAEIGIHAPDLLDDAQACLTRIHAREHEAWPWRSCPIHRDCYHDQVLVAYGRLAVLDLDDAAMSEPAVDVANVIAHLQLLGIQRADDPSALAPVIDAFRESAFAADPGLNDALVQYLQGTTLLRVAGIHVSRAEGAQVAAGCIAEATRLVG